MNSEKKYWFPRNHLGGDLNAPNCWQGWVFVAVWFVMAYSIHFALEYSHPLLRIMGFTFSAVLLIVVAKRKGEPPIRR